MSRSKHSVKTTGIPEHPGSQTGLNPGVMEAGKLSRWRDDINQLAFLLPDDDHRLPPFSAYVREMGRGCCEISSGHLPRDPPSKGKEDAWMMTREEYEGSPTSEEKEPTPPPAATSPLSMLQDEWCRRKVKFLEELGEVRSLHSRLASKIRGEGDSESSSVPGNNYSPVSDVAEPELVTMKVAIIPEQKKRNITWKTNTTGSRSEEDEDEKKRRRRERFGPPNELNGASSSINVTLDEVIQERNITYTRRNPYWEGGELNDRGSGGVRRGQRFPLESQKWTSLTSHPDYDPGDGGTQIDFDPRSRRGWSR